jgi:hypothetical protein
MSGGSRMKLERNWKRKKLKGGIWMKDERN